MQVKALKLIFEKNKLQIFISAVVILILSTTVFVNLLNESIIDEKRKSFAEPYSVSKEVVEKVVLTEDIIKSNKEKRMENFDPYLYLPRIATNEDMSKIREARNKADIIYKNYYKENTKKDEAIIHAAPEVKADFGDITFIDKINFYATMGAINIFEMFFMAIFAFVVAVILMSLEKMNRFNTFVHSLPISKRQWFVSKGILGTGAIIGINILATIINFVIYKSSQIGDFVYYNTYFEAHFSILLQSLAIFYIVMLVGTFTGNILSQLITSLPVLSGFIYAGIFVYAMPISVLFNKKQWFNKFIDEFKFYASSIYTSPIVATTKVSPCVDALIMFLLGLAAFGVGIVICKFSKYYYSGRFFTIKVADVIFYVLGVYSVALLVATIVTVTGSLVTVWIFFLITLIATALGFRYLFKIKMGS